MIIGCVCAGLPQKSLRSSVNQEMISVLSALHVLVSRKTLEPAYCDRPIISNLFLQLPSVFLLVALHTLLIHASLTPYQFISFTSHHQAAEDC